MCAGAWEGSALRAELARPPAAPDVSRLEPEAVGGALVAALRAALAALSAAVDRCAALWVDRLFASLLFCLTLDACVVLPPAFPGNKSKERRRTRARATPSVFRQRIRV